jgi:hypothetical protein
VEIHGWQLAASASDGSCMDLSTNVGMEGKMRLHMARRMDRESEDCIGSAPVYFPFSR